MKAVFNNIIVSVINHEEDNNQVGLLLPNQLSNEGFEEAVVISVPEEHSGKLSVGDSVLIYKGCGKEFHHPHSNEPYRVVNISEIPVIL